MADSCNFTFYSSGDSVSLRNSLIPFVCDIEQGLTVLNGEELAKQYSINEIFKITRGPTADAGFFTTIAVGIIAFVGGWAGNKFLDEVYEAKLRPCIKLWLHRLDDGLAKNSKESPKQLHVGIWYEDRKVLVLVVIEADDYKKMIVSEPLVKSAHESAAKWIEENGVISPIHVHLIKNGNVNIKPMPFKTVEEFGAKTRKRRTLTISSTRPSLRAGD